MAATPRTTTGTAPDPAVGVGSIGESGKGLIGGGHEVYAVPAAGHENDRGLTRERHQETTESFCVTG